VIDSRDRNELVLCRVLLEIPLRAFLSRLITPEGDPLEEFEEFEGEKPVVIVEAEEAVAAAAAAEKDEEEVEEEFNGEVKAPEFELVPDVVEVMEDIIYEP